MLISALLWFKGAKHVYKGTETIHCKNLVEAHSGLNHTQYSIPGVGIKAEDGLDTTCYLVRLSKKTKQPKHGKNPA